MKRFNQSVLTSVFSKVLGRITTVTEATQKTFDEIYGNLDDLDSRMVSVAYDEDSETLSLSFSSDTGDTA